MQGHEYDKNSFYYASYFPHFIIYEMQSSFETCNVSKNYVCINREIEIE